MATNIFKSVMILAAAAVCNFANAQEVVHDTVYANHITDHQAMMIEAGYMNSRGCHDNALDEDGLYVLTNCNGWNLYGGAVVDFISANSELGEFNPTVVGGRFGAEYDFWGLRPGVSYTKYSSCDLEGVKFSGDEFKFNLSYNFFRHSPVSCGIDVNYTARLWKSIKKIETDKVSMTLPYSGRCGSFGVGGYLEVKLASFTHDVRFNDGVYKHHCRQKSQLKVRLGANWNPYKVEKLEGSELQSTLKINTVQAYATLVYHFK